MRLDTELATGRPEVFFSLFQLQTRPGSRLYCLGVHAQRGGRPQEAGPRRWDGGVPQCGEE